MDQKSIADIQVDRLIKFNPSNTITINKVADWDNARTTMGLAIANFTTGAEETDPSPNNLKISIKK